MREVQRRVTPQNKYQKTVLILKNWIMVELRVRYFTNELARQNE
ncbi:hypothetical protein ALT785_240052 [Alteromonas infernus]